MYDSPPRCDGTGCGGCPEGYVCHCLKITEEMVVEAVENGARTVQDLRRQIGAGDGCMACHRRLESFLKYSAQVSLELVTS